MDNIYLKFIDDMTAAVSINLKEKLIKNPDPNPIRPLQYHDRTLHLLPEDDCQIQSFLNNLQEYANDHQMKINEGKTKVIMFNNAKKYDFPPNLQLENGCPLEVVEEIRLLGVQVRADLSWRSNTTVMCQKSYARLWILRRLKPIGASTDEITLSFGKKKS